MDYQVVVTQDRQQHYNRLFCLLPPFGVVIIFNERKSFHELPNNIIIVTIITPTNAVNHHGQRDNVKLSFVALSYYIILL